MNLIKARIRRPGSYWHNTNIEVFERHSPGRRRIILILEDGKTSIELNAGRVIELINEIADAYENGREELWETA